MALQNQLGKSDSGLGNIVLGTFQSLSILSGPILAAQILPVADAGLIPTETAANDSYGNRSRLTFGDVIFVHNTDSVSHTVTITSAPDAFGRSTNIVYTIPAGKLALLGPFQHSGWEQTDDYLHYQADSPLVTLSPISVQR